MPAPVISPVTSLNLSRVGQYSTLLLAASNTPTSWTCEGSDATAAAVVLASIGLTFDTVHGRLYGAFKQAGFYNLIFTATNADGTSAALTVPIGIEDTDFVVDATIGIEVDVETGVVTRTGGGAGGGGGAAAAPILTGKHGDQMLITVTFKKQGTVISLDLVELNLGIKETEPESLVDLTAGTFYALGGSFRILLDLNQPAVATALGNHEDDALTAFPGIAELRWRHYEQVSDGAAPVALISRSRHFLFQVERELISNTA